MANIAVIHTIKIFCEKHFKRKKLLIKTNKL